MSSHETHSQLKNETETAGGIGLLLSFFFLALIAAGAWYLLGMNTGVEHEKVASHETHTAVENKKQEMPAVISAGKADSLGNYIYELGKMVAIELPNSAGKLEVGEFSTENKLVSFLSDASAKIDTVKGNWFEFTNVRFKSGGAELDSSSIAQLNNLAAIAKGFPNAAFKIGGYSDHGGDSAKNVALSQKRADAVFTKLKSRGANSKSFLSAKGYGPLYPIGDNATADGKAMNRRVAVNVKTK
jgi:outer membrane protein OmpA-like peptidoglycan-associated protein